MSEKTSPETAREIVLGSLGACQRACDLADAIVAEACERWGHIRSVDRCERCGAKLTQKHP